MIKSSTQNQIKEFLRFMPPVSRCVEREQSDKALGFPLVRLNQDENVVNTDLQHQKGNDFNKDDSSNYVNVAKSTIMTPQIPSVICLSI